MGFASAACLLYLALDCWFNTLICTCPDKRCHEMFYKRTRSVNQVVCTPCGCSIGVKPLTEPEVCGMMCRHCLLCIHLLWAVHRMIVWRLFVRLIWLHSTGVWPTRPGRQAAMQAGTLAPIDCTLGATSVVCSSIMWGCGLGCLRIRRCRLHHSHNEDGLQHSR
jgi:hypothetical protein